MARHITAAEADRILRKVLKDVAKLAKKRMLQPTSTWKHSVDFNVSEPAVVAGDLKTEVITHDPPYYFLDEGTKTPRHAAMTEDFSPKTSVRSFKASAGSGGLLFVHRKIQKPGIEARKWTEMTALEYGPILQSAIDQAIAGIAHKGLFGLARQRRGVIGE